MWHFKDMPQATLEAIANDKHPVMRFFNWCVILGIIGQLASDMILLFDFFQAGFRWIQAIAFGATVFALVSASLWKPESR